MDDSSYGQHSVASASSFQVQLMRCGFLPSNSVSSFDLKDLSDLEVDEINVEVDGASHNDDHSDATTCTRDSRSRSISPKPNPAPRRGLRATLSFRLSRRLLFDDGDEGQEAPAQPESRSSVRNEGLRRRVQRTQSAGEKMSSMRRSKTT